MTRIIHTGQALVDLVVEVPAVPPRGQNVMATSATRYAGGSVNVLVAAARSGAVCVHAGAVGTGPNGDLIRDALAAEGITLSADPLPDADTGLCIVLVEPSAERTFVTTLGAERRISGELLALCRPEPGELVCVSGYTLVLERTREPLLAWLATLDPGVVVVLDPDAAFASLPAEVRDAMLGRVDVWTSNLDEARTYVRVGRGAGLDERAIVGMAGAAQAVAGLLPPGVVVIVRDGPAGCAVVARGATTVVPGFPQPAVDTNGAGDCHTGVLLAEVAAGGSWPEAARRANAAAAIKVTRHGPATAPTTAEVDAFLEAR